MKELDDLSDAMHKLNSSMEKLSNIFETMAGNITKQDYVIDSSVEYKKEEKNIYNTEFKLYEEIYEGVLRSHKNKRKLAIVLKKDNTFETIDCDGLILLLLKIFNGYFKSKEDIFCNSEYYRNSLLKEMRESWRQIMSCRYGFKNSVVLSLDETRRVFCCGFGEVREIEQATIRRLKKLNFRIRRRYGQENYLMYIGNEMDADIFVIAISCKLGEFFRDKQIKSMQDLELYECELQKYKLSEEIFALNETIEKITK